MSTYLIILFRRKTYSAEPVCLNIRMRLWLRRLSSIVSTVLLIKRKIFTAVWMHTLLSDQMCLPASRLQEAVFQESCL